MASRPPRRAPQQARSQETVAIILQGTDLLVRESGTRGWSMRDVAARAGVSVGTLYQYFADREAMLTAWEERALETIAVRLGTRLMAMFEEHPPLEQAIATMLDLAFGIALEHMATYPEADLGELYSGRERRSATHDGIARVVADALDAARDAHRLRPGNRLDMARVLVHSVAYLAYALSLAERDDATRAAARATTVRMLVHGVLVDADDALIDLALRG